MRYIREGGALFVFLSRIKNLAGGILYCALLSSLWGCSVLIPKQESVEASYVVHINDVWFKQLTKVANKINVDANGVFKKGNYEINGITLGVEEGTAFKLNLTLPIDRPDFIDTKKATGELWTSKPLHSHGLLLPQKIVIENGQVSGEVDFVRVLGSFVFNLLQEQLSASDNAMRNIILSLYVDDARMSLRPDAIFEMDNKKLHIGKNSQISLSDVLIDKNFNYVGTCKLDLNFLSANEWTGKKVDCDFQGGHTHLVLKAQGQDKKLSFITVPAKEQLIALDQALFKFGKNKRSVALCKQCKIYIKELTWQKDIDERDADLHILADLSLIKTNLNVKTDRHQTIAYFPETEPAQIQINISRGGERDTQFRTIGSALAKSAVIKIFRPSTKLSLDLTNAKIGPLSFDKAGNLNLSFAEGKAKLNELSWANEKRILRLKCSDYSELSLPQGMYMLLGKTGVRMSLPLRIKMGSANLESGHDSMTVAAIDGKIFVEVDKEISLQGDISFVLEKSGFLGSREVVIKVKGLKLLPRSTVALAHLQSCSLIISNEDLADLIQRQFPEEKCLNLDKTIFEKKHWRYKNAEIKTITLYGTKLEKLNVEGINSARLILSADVRVDGTIEKNSVLSIVKEYKNYKTKPWQLKAQCIGLGNVTFRFVCDKGLSTSVMAYKLNVNLPVPDDFQLDWSKVENGLYKHLEHNTIVSILKKMRTIPVTYAGVQPLFAKPHTALDTVKLSNIKTRGVPQGVEVDFVADAAF